MADQETEEIPDEEPTFGNDASRADAIRDEILRSDKRWRGESNALTFPDGLRWAPPIVSDDSSEVVHIHLSEAVPGYVRRRLIAAASDGLSIRVALTLEALYDNDVLMCLCETDAWVFLIHPDNSIDGPHHHLAVLGDQDVPVDIGLRASLAMAAWERRATGTSHEKGRRLEALLTFLLGQVADFAIWQRNFRADTDEIDIVVQIVAQSVRCWREEGVPFILVESKNWAEQAGQPQISLLIRHMETRRKRVRIGMFFSANGFSSDARDEELKLAATPLSVVMAGPKEIEDWIAASDPDKFLENLVARAMLR